MSPFSIVLGSNKTSFEDAKTGNLTESDNVGDGTMMLRRDESQFGEHTLTL